MKRTLHKKTYHPTISKSIVSSSSSSSSSDSESSASDDSKNTARIGFPAAAVTLKNTPPAKTLPKPPILEIEETVQVTVTNTPKPEEGSNVNGLNQAQHKEHVAILDKICASLKEDVKRGLDLISASAKQLSQAKWIFVSVQNSLDDFYSECPVCQAQGNLSHSCRGRDLTVTQSARTEESKDSFENKNNISNSHEEVGNSQIFNNEDEDKPKIIQPMGRSGYTLSKELEKFKGKLTSPQSSKLEKIRVSVPVSNSSKRPGSAPRSITPAPDALKDTASPVQTSTNRPGPKSSKVAYAVQENLNKSVSAPTNYKAGPRSKTRPLETPLEMAPKPSVSEGAKSSIVKMANAPNLTQTQLSGIRELIKSGSKVHINLADISELLNGENHVKDWRKVQHEISQSMTEKCGASIKSKQSSIKGGPSDLDEETTLYNLKRKNSDAAYNPSKKHKSSSHSTKVHRKHSTEKENADKCRSSKSKNILSSRERDKDGRKSIDSHTSSKSRKSPDRASSSASSKHSKSIKSISSDVILPVEKSVPEPIKKGTEDSSDFKPTVASGTTKLLQDNSSSSDHLPLKSEKSAETIDSSSIIKPQTTQSKPIDPVAAKAAALQKEAILKLLKDKFSSFKSLKARESPSLSAAPTTAQDTPESFSNSANPGDEAAKIEILQSDKADSIETELAKDVPEPDQVSVTQVITTESEELVTPAAVPMDDSSEEQIKSSASPTDADLSDLVPNPTSIVEDSDEPIMQGTTPALPSSVSEPNIPLDEAIEMDDSAFSRLLSSLKD